MNSTCEERAEFWLSLYTGAAVAFLVLAVCSRIF